VTPSGGYSSFKIVDEQIGANRARRDLLRVKLAGATMTLALPKSSLLDGLRQHKSWGDQTWAAKTSIAS
jgi:hypothetical protein